MSSSLCGVRCKTFTCKNHLLNGLQVFVKEFKVDGKLDHLMRAMSDILALISARSTATNPRNKELVIMRLLQQVVECFLFINKYSQKNFEGEIDLLFVQIHIHFL